MRSYKLILESTVATTWYSILYKDVREKINKREEEVRGAKGKKVSYQKAVGVVKFLLR